MGKVLIIKDVNFTKNQIIQLDPLIINFNTDTMEILLSMLVESNIYYTLDGSTPTQVSEMYKNVLVPNNGINIIKAFGVYKTIYTKIPNITIILNDDFTSISVFNDNNYEMRYTSDGTKPTIDSPLYTLELSITNDVLYKFSCFSNNERVSKIAQISVVH